MTREELEFEYGAHDVWDTFQLIDKFKVVGFTGKTVFVIRREDNVRGKLRYQQEPRFYYGFTADPSSGDGQ